MKTSSSLKVCGLLPLLLAFLCIPMRATLNVKHFGAQGDGRTNDTASLNRAFSVACAASENVYLPAGTYLVSSFRVLRNCGVTFYGDGAANTTLRLTAATAQSMWTFKGSPARTPSLVLQDLSLDGGHLGSAGIEVEQFQAVVITRLSVHDFGTPGYALGHRKDFDGIYIRNVENVQISESEFSGNERYGIEMQAVHSSTVRHSVMNFNGGMGGVSEQNFEGPLDGPLLAQWLDNTLTANGSGGIDVETAPELSPAEGILKGNQVNDCGNDKWDAGWGLVLGLHAFGTIEGNSVQNFAASSAASQKNYTSAIVYGQNAGPINIINNTVVGTKSRAILGNNGASPVAITGNTLTRNGTGIFIYASPHVRITDNIVTDNSGFGIVVFWCAGSTIGGNHLAGNLQDLTINGHGATQGRPIGFSDRPAPHAPQNIAGPHPFAVPHHFSLLAAASVTVQPLPIH